MKPEDILDAIGDIDDKYITQAKEKKHKHTALTFGAVAACFIILLLIPTLGVALIPAGKEAPLQNDNEQNLIQQVEIISIELERVNTHKTYEDKDTIVRMLDFFDTVTYSSDGEEFVPTDGFDTLNGDDLLISIYSEEGLFKQYKITSDNYLYYIQAQVKYTLSPVHLQLLKDLLEILQ